MIDFKTNKRNVCAFIKKKIRKKNVVRLYLALLTQTPHGRNPVRHTTGEMSLQSEASLKRHLQCLELLSDRELPARACNHRGVRTGRQARGI